MDSFIPSDAPNELESCAWADFDNLREEAAAAPNAVANTQAIASELDSTPTISLLAFLPKTTAAPDIKMQYLSDLNEYLLRALRQLQSQAPSLTTKYKIPTPISAALLATLTNISVEPHSSNFLKIRVGLNPNLPHELWVAIRFIALTFAPLYTDKVTLRKDFFLPIASRLLAFPLVPQHATSIVPMLDLAQSLNAIPYFIPSKTDPLFVLSSNDEHFTSQAQEKNLTFTITTGTQGARTYYPCFTGNSEAHCYFVYADQLFIGRDVNTIPSNIILNSLKRAFEPLKLPLPVYAQAISTSVVRLYFASPKDMNTLATSTLGNVKKLAGTFNNQGLVVILLTQSVLAHVPLLALLAALALITCCRPGNVNALNTTKHASIHTLRRQSRLLIPLHPTTRSALALLRTWLKTRTHSPLLPLSFLRWTLQIYKLSFLHSIYICLAVTQLRCPTRTATLKTLNYKLSLLLVCVSYLILRLPIHTIIPAVISKAILAILIITNFKHTQIATLLLLLVAFIPPSVAIGNDALNVADSTITSWVFLTLNVGGGLKDKITELLTYLRAHKTDFAIVTETGLIRKDLTRNEYFSKGFDRNYVAYHVAPLRHKKAHNAAKKERRGISVVVHHRWLNYISEKDIEYHQDLNLIRIPIIKGDTTTQLIAIYAEPETSLREKYWVDFEKWFAKHEHANDRLVLIGDFNAPLNPRLDKSSPNVHREETYAGLRDIIDSERLLDTWRLKHGHKREYTWMANSEDHNAPMTRIDHALISPALEPSLHSCDILKSHKPLTTDHKPVRLEIERPINMRDSSNIDSAPEFTIKTIDVGKLQEAKYLLEYQQLFTEDTLREIRASPKSTQYNALRDAITTNAITAVDKKGRIMNSKPKPTVRTLLERLASYCHTVLLSKHHIRKSIAKKLEFPITKTLNKLLRFLPADYILSDPTNITNVNDAEDWLQELSKLSHRINTDMLAKWKDKKIERILENCDRATNRETSDTRGFFAKASGLIYKTRRGVKQLAVDLEIPTAVPGAPLHVDDEVGVKSETSRFWEAVFKERSTEGIPQNTPWFSEKFKARRAQLCNAAKLLEPITMQELNAALTKLKNKKAAGPDDIAGELLKNLPEPTIQLLLEILEDIRRDPSLIPEDWKLAKIFLLHKSGNANHCSNYRPISITSVMYKVYMNIQTERLTKVVEENNLLSDAQGGFRRKRSTMDKVAQLAAIFAARIRNGQENHTIFVDFKKAYDSVPHEQLFQTLLQHGIPEQFVQGLRTLYTKTKASVITAYGMPDPFPITRGVKQGCPMSPILFNLFLEPLLEWLQDGANHDNHVLAFADDVALNAHNEVELQQSMDRIQAFCHYHAMEIGIAKNKTAYMTNSPRDCNIYYCALEESWGPNGNILLKPAAVPTKLAKLTGDETYKYLGVYIHPRLDWTEHYDRVEARLRQHLHFLYSSCYTHRQMIRIINVLIVPYITYGMEVIDPNTVRLNRLDRMLERIVNSKGGIIHNAKREYNYLSTDMLGQGQISIREKVNKLQHQGRLKHGLNSPDKLTEKVVRSEWNAPTSWYSKQRFEANNPSKFKITAQTYPLEKSLEHLLADNDPIRVKLRNVYHVQDVDALITPDGSLVENIARDEAIRKHLCIGSSTRIKPILLFRAKPTLAIQGVIHEIRDPNEQVTIFTDGSQQDDKVGYAMFLAKDHQFNYAEAEPPGTRNFKAELHAAISALLLHDPLRPLRLIIDNKSVCNVLDAPLRATTNHPDEIEWLTAAHEVLCIRRELKLETRIIHVYSHLDERNTSEKMQAKIRKMKEKFGNELPHITAGNEAADKLAKEAARQTPSPMRQLNRYMDPYQLADPSPGKALVFNVTESLTQEFQDKYCAVLESAKDRNKLPRYDYLSRKGIDWHRSAYLGKNTNRAANSAQRHAHKSRRQMFADKETRYERRNSKFFTTRYRKITVQDPHCDLCRDLEEQPIIETRTHYLHCKGLVSKRAKIKTQVLSAINKHLRQPIRDIPCYWNDDEKHHDQTDKLWRAIEKYTPEDAARALVPKAWVAYLKKLNWNNKEDIEPAIATCQLLIVQGLYESWKVRCIHFYRKHRPPPPASPT